MRNMIPNLKVLSKLALAGLAVLMAGAQAPATAAEAQKVQSQEDQALVASIAAGGRIYDNWMRELALRAPKTVHPLYPASGQYANDPVESWRCVSCHGWDYLGDNGAFNTGADYTGIKGVSGMIGSKPADVIAVLKDDKHGYGELLDDQALTDVANFVVKGLVPMDSVIDRASRRVMIEPIAQSTHFSTICVNCHGADGRSMDSIPPLGDAARENPWKALHKMLNGHPGDDMPALRAFDVRTVLSTLSFVQNLPPRDPLYSVARGGKLYDNWADVLDTAFPKGDHPAFPKGQKVEYNSSSWRCVECHGWDYKGAHGVRGIRNMVGAHPAAIIKVLKDKTHALDHKLHYADLYDLASFVSRGQVEMNEYIDPDTHKAHGTADNSTKYYLTLCATCHGDDGRAIRTMPPMGRVANERPWQALHKILHGHPGDNMPAWQATMTPSEIKDVLAKLQTLPQHK